MPVLRLQLHIPQHKQLLNSLVPQGPIQGALLKNLGQAPPQTGGLECTHADDAALPDCENRH